MTPILCLSYDANDHLEFLDLLALLALLLYFQRHSGGET